MRLYVHFRYFVGVVAGLLAVTMPAMSSSTNSPGFVLQLGQDSRTIQITPEYKEAALKASLPIFSDFAQRLELPIPHPLTRGDIVECGLTPFQRNGGEIDHIFIATKQGFHFALFFGVVCELYRPDSYRLMQNVHSISNYFGTVKTPREQAIQIARDTIKKAGIQLEDVFAEQEPQVTVPTWGTNTIARYLIEWYDPRCGDKILNTAMVEINTEIGRVESLHILPSNGLKKPSPKPAIVPPLGHGMFDAMIPPAMNPDYAWKLIPVMFRAIEDYSQKLSLPIPRPLTTNNVARVDAYNNEGWPHCEIWLTNGWHFVYRHTMVNGYYAPDNFFDSDNRKIHIKDFDGKWNLTTNQAIAIVAKAMAKLNYPTNNVHMGFAPRVYAASVAREHIPRLRFEWEYEANDDLQSRLEAEVNLDDGKLESLYYDDKAYWGSRPPIDVPISSKSPKP